MADETKKFTVQKMLNLDVLIPASLVIGIGSFLIWATTAMSDIKHKLEDIDAKLSSTITEESFENWTLKLKIANPNLVIPDAPKKHY